jgi:hypothetical protein
MISEIKQAIINKLLAVYPTGYKRYDEDIPQKFEPPLFVVSTIDQVYDKRMNTKYNGLVSFDVKYFSDKGVTAIKADCLQKQEDLLRAFDYIGNHKVLNKDARITDNVLHLIFDVKYSEMKTETSVQMQKQQTNTSL